MIPLRYVEELKSAPIKEVDFVGTFFEVKVTELVTKQLSNGIRCLKAVTRRWVADQLCIHV